MGDRGCQTLVTIDGTDMPGQHKFDPNFMSHKFTSNGMNMRLVSISDVAKKCGSMRHFIGLRIILQSAAKLY
jgi:hypothetical protein